MTNLDLPMQIYELAFLQAFLYQIFTTESTCNKNFNNTEWYLNDKYTHAEVNSIINFFKNNGINCDCDIIYKIDLKHILKNTLKSHNQIIKSDSLQENKI